MSTPRTLPLLVLLVALAPVPLALAQEPDPVAVIEASGETPLTEFLDRMSEATGETLLYDPNSQRIRNQTIGSGFRHEVPRARLLDAYRAILAHYELMLTPAGPRGHEVLLVTDTRSANTLVRFKPTYVSYEELESHADRDGLLVTCAIPVRHIENLTLLRTALSTMVTPGGIGRVNEVPGSGTLIVTDFAPTVVAMARLVREMDMEPAEASRLESIALEHADASALAEILTRLLALPPQPQRMPQPSVGGAEPARVIAWEHGNALVVAAPAPALERIRALVAQLDRPVAGERATRILALREAGARYAAAVIESTLKERGAEGAVAADPATNAVIVSGDRRVLQELQQLIQALEEICRTL